MLASWTSEGVREGNAPGSYSVVGGIQAPDAGGYIVWGLRTQDLVEGTIEPAVNDPTPAILERLGVVSDLLLTAIRSLSSQVADAWAEAAREHQPTGSSEGRTLAGLQALAEQVTELRAVAENTNTSLVKRDLRRRILQKLVPTV